MMLDEYPVGPALVIGDADAQAVAVLSIDWPEGLIYGLTAFTLSDSARVELVVPAHIRPATGEGSECPCGGDRKCAGCGGTGVFRGVTDAVVIYQLTPKGAETCVAFGDEVKELKVIGGFVPRCFEVALHHRARGPRLPVDVVLNALEEMRYRIERL